MKLENYAKKYGFDIENWNDELTEQQQEDGWERLAVFSPECDCEPVMTLMRSPRWPGYQVRNVWGDLRTGQMVSEKELKAWIKKQAA